MVTVLKTVVAQATVGSNPTPSAIFKAKKDKMSPTGQFQIGGIIVFANLLLTQII